MGNRLLTAEEISEIQHAIARNTGAGDRESSLVIEEDYGGDAILYLISMAGWHGIPIGIERIFQKIESLARKSSLIDRDSVLETIKGLSIDEIGFLISKLRGAKEAVAKKATDDTSDIVSNARAEASFLSGGLPEYMAEFYDNEVRAVHIGAHEKSTEIDSMIGVLEDTVKQLKGK